MKDLKQKIEILREEYDRIQNYEYENYDDSEFEALDRARRIVETVFNLKFISEYYGVKIFFKKTNYEMAYYDDNRKAIFVDKSFKNNFNELIPIIFHELGHKFCFEHNIYKHYHYETDWKLFKLTALKAERYCDKYAKRELEKHKFNVDYPMYYYQPNRTRLFKKYINSYVLQIKKYYGKSRINKR
jgi:hypothetical protein